MNKEELARRFVEPGFSQEKSRNADTLQQWTKVI